VSPEKTRSRHVGRPRSLAVDLRGTAHLVGVLTKYLSLATLVPIAVAIGYGETPVPFLLTGVLVGGGGWLVERLTRGSQVLQAREGFLIVSLVWVVAAAIAALPYLLSGEGQLDRPIDAYFEGMAGFTTTGGTVLTNVESLSHSLLIWRQLTQWLGGLGIIVLALAVFPRLRVGGRQLFESELPGPEIESLNTRIRDTARRLWILYVVLTAVLIAVLWLLGASGADSRMSGFEAVAHALTTIPTGGFSTNARSVEDYAAVTQWTLVVFMILGGANFALLYTAFVRRHGRKVLRDEEFRLYLGLLAVGALILGLQLGSEGIAAGEAAVRHAVFQSVSIMTTTGYSSTDFAVWPTLALMTLIGLMFVGGSAGSTSGSVKVVRHVLLGKILRRELDQTVHPEVMSPVRLNRRIVDERTLRAVSSFILLYIGIFIVGAALIAIDAARVGLDLRVLDAVGVSAAMLGNVGPSFGVAGPLGSLEPFSDVSTAIMIALMWLGRLEVIPIVVLFTRHYWRST
jgi:trk system potassium uptake protein